MDLKEILIRKIKEEGPISFHDFMEIALYYPSLGYYNSDRNKIGKDGDYYTSPVLSSLFGQMIGKQIGEMWLALDKRPFTIVEYGAGTAALCHDILNYFKITNYELFKKVHYCIIEKSESMRDHQKKLFSKKISWHNSINEISPVNGCILSNEVLDNFPVHKVIMQNELMEIFVDYKDQFIEILKPANENLKNYLVEQNVILPADFCTEINLEAINWLQQISLNLNCGFILTIDYGFSSKDLYSPERNAGTLLCYKGHEIKNSPYHNIGEQDITAHVNFSALNQWGEKYNLRCMGFTSQSHFLRSLGLINHLRQLELENNNKDTIYQINKLLLDMGNKFKILIQQKGVESKTLTGLQFANPAP